MTIRTFAVAVVIMVCACAASAAHNPSEPACFTLPNTTGGHFGQGITAADLPDAIVAEYRRRSTAHSPDATSFLAALDYTDYLKKLSFKNKADASERVRTKLNELDANHQLGNEFILLLADTYYREFPADYYVRNPRANKYQWLSDRTEIGVFYIGTVAKHVSPRDHEGSSLYELVGTYILFQIASHIDVELEAGRLDRASVASTMEMLQQHGVPVGRPKGNLQKAWEDFRHGNFDKLAKRALDTTFTGYYRRIVTDQYTAGALKPACGLSRWRVSGSSLGDIGTLYVFDRARFSVAYEVTSGIGAVLRSYPAAVIGMSASYTDQNDIPYGFTVVKGRVRNFTLSRRMDGLVSVSSGDIEVMDLRQAAHCGGHALHPFVSLPDYYCLVRCAGASGGSIFQTHLLYSGGKPALDPSAATISAKGKIDRRERRILAMTSNRLIVFDITISCTLAEATFLIEKAMALGSISVSEIQAAINLDTGTYDIMDVFCPTGTLTSTKKKHTSEARNLLIFTPK